MKRTAGIVVATVALVLAALGHTGLPGVADGPGAASASPRTSGASSAARWLAAAQNRDGGFGATRKARSSTMFTTWAALGLAAAGRNPHDVRRGRRPSPVAYLRSRARSIRSTPELERTILVLAAAGSPPTRFRGRNLVRELRRKRSRNGSFRKQVNLTAFGILALRAAKQSRASQRPSTRWLRGSQNSDGGWGIAASARSDTDSTAAAIQALAATGGRRSRAVRRGVSFLRRAQHRSGGYGIYRGDGPNSQSTAWAIQGLRAAGVSPRRVRRSGRSPLRYLAARRARDGHYRYSSSSDQTPVWVTSQVLMALRGKSFPLRRVSRR